MTKHNISLKKNMLLMLIYRIFVTAAPLITTPYICRVLTPEGLGDYGYTQSICAYFGAFAALGTSLYGQREIAFVRDDEDKMSKCFWEILCFRMITTFISIIIYIVLVNWFFKQRLKLFFIIQIMDLIGGLLDISWFYIGIEIFSKVFIKNAILKAVSIAFIFVFVKDEPNIYLYVIINSLALLLSNLAFWIGLSKYVKKVPFWGLQYRKHIPAIVTLFLPSIAAIIYNKVDMTMLGFMKGSTVDVAYYQQTLKISTICATTISTVSGVIAPRLAYIFSNRGEKELNKYFIKGLDAICLFGIPISLGMFSIAGSFIPQFLGEKYMTTIGYLKLMSPLCFIAGINNYIGAQYLVTTKRQNQYTCLVLIGTVTNIICNVIGISKLGGIGAIMASIVSETVILAVGFWLIRKEFCLWELGSVLFKKLISGSIMCVVVLLAVSKLSVSIVNVLIEITIGIIVYFTLLLALNDSFTRNTFKALIGRINHK